MIYLGFRELYGDQFIMKAAEAVLHDKYKRGITVSSPKAMSDYFINALSYKDREQMMVVLMDAKNRIIDKKILFKGTVDQTSVYPREIVRFALNCNASAASLCHNHPSGIATPSEADKTITTRVKRALELIEVRLLDHIIVAGNDSLSMAEYGYV